MFISPFIHSSIYPSFILSITVIPRCACATCSHAKHFISILPITQYISVAKLQSRLFQLNRCIRNWNSNRLIPIYLQPDGVNLWYFKFRLYDKLEFIYFEISKVYDNGLQIIEIKESEFVAKIPYLCITLWIVVLLTNHFTSKYFFNHFPCPYTLLSLLWINCYNNRPP